jgi:hypothetical protein
MDQNTCIYCKKENPADAKYCIQCGMPFEEGEIPVVPGDVFQPNGSPSASLGFDTTLPFDPNELC